MSALIWRKEFVIHDLRQEMRNAQGAILKYTGTHPFLLMQGVVVRNLALTAEIIGRNFDELVRIALAYDGHVDLTRQGIGFRTIEAADKFFYEVIEPGVLAVQMAKHGRAHSA